MDRGCDREQRSAGHGRRRSGRRGSLAIALLGWALAGAPATAAPLSVDACVHLALDRSPSMQAAAADVAAAEARVRAARAVYWPRLLGQAQYGHSEGYDVAITNGGMTQLGVAVEAPLLDGGRRAAELAAARAQLRSSSALAQQRRADVAFAVRSAYYAALAGREQVDIYGDAVRALNNYLALLQRQVGLGLAPASDVPRAQLALETAHSAGRAAGAGETASLSEVSELTGVPLDGDALLEPSGPPLVPATPECIEASPVLADARAGADAARHDADAARSEGRPQLTLNADGGFLGVNPGPTFRDNGGGEFLFGFSVPLFDGGAIAARVAAAAAAALSADAGIGQTRQTLVIALAHTRADAERAHADAEGWRRVQPAADEALLLMRARYFGGGAVQLVDVLDALGQAIDARVAVARASLDYRVAVATHDQLLGRVGP